MNDPLYNQMLDRIFRRTDAMFGGLLIAEWIFAIFCALVISPRSWEGDLSNIHIHVYAAIFLGGALVSLPLLFIYKRRGQEITRHITAFAQMMMSALLIHLTGGRIETHFHVFGSLAFLAFYRDWKVLITASVVVALDHFLRGVYWPLSVYGVAVANPFRWLEHAAWVIFEDVFLIYSCLKGREELREISNRQRNLEIVNTRIEKTINERTEQLQKTQTQLLQSQKMEAIGTLASGMAHDFNNLLAGIFSYAGLIREDTKENPELRDFANKILISANHGAELINKILTFARKGPLKKSSLAPEKTLLEASTLLDRTLDKKITVENKIPEGIWPILGDPTLIMQILMNLGVNASDAMPGGGKLILEICNDLVTNPELNPHLNNLRPGKYVRISVTDTGTGMAKENLQAIFEPFFTTKEVGKGTGLGLSMVYGIMQSHEGTVSVYSELGEGTTFHLYFPALEEAEIPQAEIPPAPLRPDLLKGMRILLAEDEDIVRKGVQHILERQGGQVRMAANGEEALQMFSQNSQGFDLVILDVTMPKLDGISTLFQMHAIRPEDIFLLVTGFAEHSRLNDVKNRFPHIQILRKPYHPQQLTEQIQKLMGERSQGRTHDPQRK